MNKINLVW